MLAFERKEIIKAEILQSGSILVSEMSKKLDCSEETIRRDLKDLETDGKIKRIHGGAYLSSLDDRGLPIRIRQTLLLKEKQDIADYAFSHFISENDTIMLDSSTTCVTFAKKLFDADMPVTIITNSLLIFSAPSGSGKSTIVQWLMKEHPELNLHFSISCTSRAPRGTEQNGVEYFFLSPEEFKQKIANGEFLEYEEVYKDRFYGTLKSQVEDQIERGENVVFDVDVKGGCNIKQFYGDRAMSIFVQPPSIEELRRRLNGRGTDLPEVIEQRLAKANYELSFAPKFDHIVVNDDLETAKQETHKLLISFLNNR